MAVTDGVVIVSLADRLATLPKYYTYRDVLTIVFADNEDAFLDAYCDGGLPIDVRRVCVETMGETLLQLWLLRRIARLQADQLAAWRSRP